jgi:hypothetical protein
MVHNWTHIVSAGVRWGYPIQSTSNGVLGGERAMRSCCYGQSGFWSSALLLRMVTFLATDTFHFLTLGAGLADFSVGALSAPLCDRVSSSLEGRVHLRSF